MKKYRILPLLLIVCLLLTAAFPASAAKSTADNSADAPQSTANVSSDGVPQSTVQAAEGSYVLGSDAVKSALDEKLGANCVLLVDEDSGQYYYTRNIDTKAYPASLTKIMTLLLAVEAVERGDVQLDDTVTAYADCNADMVEGASNADIKVGLAKSNGKYIEIDDRKEAIAYCMTHAKPGDMIVLLGKGHEDYQEIKGVKYHFDEREAVAEILDEIKSGERTVEA